MRTGRITLYAYDERGTLHTKAFNFSFSRYVNYWQAHRILNKLHKDNYAMHFRGGAKKVKRNPMMTWAQVCTAVRDWRFYGDVSKKITVKVPHLTYISADVTKFRGKYYTFLRCKKEERDGLAEALASAKIYPCVSSNHCLYFENWVHVYFKKGFLTLRAEEPLRDPIYQEL